MHHRKIRAAVFRSPDARIRIESLEMEGPRDNEVLVRLVSSGICRTDVDFMEYSGGYPVVLGHEGAGVTEAVGKDVKEIMPGDHVVLSYQSCGSCAECRRDRPAHCRNFYDLNFGFARTDGSNAYEVSGVRGHFFGQSSFATHALATERNVVKVPTFLDLPILAPLGCGLQTGAGTVMNSLKISKGASVAVFGTGSVGMAAVMAARIVGAEPIIGVDLNPGRLDLALELGATHVIDSGREDVYSSLSRIAHHGVDYALEITGDPRMYRLAVDVVKAKGTVALVATPGEPGPLPNGRRAVSIIQGDAVPQRFVPRLIDLHSDGLFPFDRLVTFYDFREFNRAVADFRQGSTIKPVLRIGEV
jgi:aryl-alcohol dehydrogenase